MATFCIFELVLIFGQLAHIGDVTPKKVWPYPLPRIATYAESISSELIINWFRHIPYQLSQHSAYPTNLIGLVMIPKSGDPIRPPAKPPILLRSRMP